MNKKEFKKEFLLELAFFSAISTIDGKKGFTIKQIEDALIKYASAFYGARIDFDFYAKVKCYFVATYAYQIVIGNELDQYVDEFWTEIEDKKKLEVYNR